MASGQKIPTPAGTDSALPGAGPGAGAACAGCQLGGFDLKIGSDGYFDHTGRSLI